MDEEAALKAEIAKLTGAISSHRQASSSSSAPTYSHYQPHYRGRGRARGGAQYAYADRGGRGRGRGAPLPARNRTLILNDTTGKASNTSSSSDPSAASTTQTSANAEHAGSSKAVTGADPATSTAQPSEGWVKRKTTHNMSLVSSSTFQKTEPARLAAIAATQTAKAEARAKAKQEAEKRKAATWTGGAATAKGRGGKGTSASVRRGDNMGEVVIDGVVFEFDPSGTKLVKKAVQPTQEASTSGTNAAGPAPSSSTAGSTPLRTSINGQAYVRTKRGNLVSAELVAKKRAQKEQQAKLRRLAAMGKQIGELQGARYASGKKLGKGGGNLTLDNTKPKGLCAFFNKTGQCKRGLSCPFTHDVNKISLCPRVLRPKGCQLPAGTCPLSHKPTPERVPHCVHYMRTGQCRNGDDCVYTHSDRLAQGLETPICGDFSRLGWCERGKDCTERHTWECPDFATKGKCDRKGCRLLHVIRAKADGAAGTATQLGPSGASSTGAGGDAETAQMQDGDLFMRDDVAADEPEELEEEEEGGATSGAKRKRPLLYSTLADDEDVYDDGLSADEGVHFLTGDGGHGRRKKRSKAFSGQKDFISFADMDEDDGEEEDGDDEEEVEDNDIGSDEDGHESVDSEEVESESGDESERGNTDSDVESGEEQNDDEEDEDMASAASEAGGAKVQYPAASADVLDDDDGDDDRLVESFL